MAVRILSEDETRRYRKIRKEYNAYIDTLPGTWLCEHNDPGMSDFFNNDTEEWFFSDNTGNIISSDLNKTTLEQAAKLVQFENRIMQSFA